MLRLVHSLLMGLLLLTMATGCSTTGEPMRFRPANFSEGTPSELDRGGVTKHATSMGNAWYVESRAPTNGAKPHSVSFVEFDGRGDFMDLAQHRSAWWRVLSIATNEPLLLVIYCHGWKNSSQSGDVNEFASYLGRLAASGPVKEKGYRVHGVYLGWRGSTVPHYVDPKNEFYRQATNDFGAPIVDSAFHRCWRWSQVIPENLDYWNRKKAAEYKVSGTAMARTVYQCATAAKKSTRADGTPNLVFVIGHSFGALMLERSLTQASIGLLVDQMPWFQPASNATANPLPFDLALFVNSAAPSIYAKQTRDMLTSYMKALQATGRGKAPVFISLTSKGDSATGCLHPLANLFANWFPSLQRDYNRGVVNTGEHRRVSQGAFYRSTPGHNPLLVNMWLAEATNAPPTGEPAMEANLRLSGETPVFFTGRDGDRPAKSWVLTTEPDAYDGGATANKWNAYQGDPIKRIQSNYWIVRCPGELIADHSDIWTSSTMDIYTALFQIARIRMKNAVHAPLVDDQNGAGSEQ